MKSKLITILLVLLSITTFATTYTIQFGGSVGLAYSPNLVMANVGDTIVWSGDFGFHPLESTSVPSGADTFNIIGGSTYSYVLMFAGDYNFHCSVHLFTGQVKATSVSGTGIKTTRNEISIYPTSVHNFLKISLPSGGKSLFAEVKNILGQTALKSEVATGSITTLDLSGLYNGIYFVAIRNDMDIVKVVRVVKE